MPDDPDVKETTSSINDPFLTRLKKKPEDTPVVTATEKLKKPRRTRKTRKQKADTNVIQMQSTDIPSDDIDLAVLAAKTRKLTARQAGKLGGRPTRRSQVKVGLAAGTGDQREVDDMSEEEAEECLHHELSPAHLALKMTRSLMMMVEAGGKSGSDAARLLDILQKKWCPQRKRTVEVVLQLA
jgi:hypothetical protein